MVVEILNFKLLAPNTRTAYSKSWELFEEFCGRGRETLPARPETVQGFLMFYSTKVKYGTLEIYLSAINKIHTLNGHNAFTQNLKVKSTMKEIARNFGRQPHRVKPLLAGDLARIFAKMPETTIALRDRAILALGFACALRRSEICALLQKDLDVLDGEEKGHLYIRRSKTDQTGIGYKIPVVDGKTIRPITYVRKWLEKANTNQNDYLFRAMCRGQNARIKPSPMHPSDIPRLVKHYAKSIGLNPKEYAGHSLRAGFITSAAQNNARLDKIMDVSRHKSTDMVMVYTRDSQVFTDHAGASFL